MITITSVKATEKGPAPSGPLVITPVLPPNIKPGPDTYPHTTGAYITWNISADQPVKDKTYVAIVPVPASGDVKWVNDDGYGNNTVYKYITAREGTAGISISVQDRRSRKPIPERQYVAFIAEEDSDTPAAVSEPFTVTAYVNPAA